MLVALILACPVWAKRSDEFRVRDPFVLREGGVYYLYNSTTLGEGAPGVSVRTSRNLNEWSEPRRVMDAPTWVKWVWAPEVHKYRDAYYMLVTLKAPPDPKHPVNLMGPAGWTPELDSPSWHWTFSFRAERPEGPFKMVSNGPLTPKEWLGLDGTLAVQDGKPFLVFTHDWAQIADGTIELAPLKEDLSELAGPPKTLFRASAVAPGTVRGVTDGPFVYRSKTGKLFITWSTHNPEKLRKGERGYCVVASESESGRLEGPWTNHRIIFDENGGHGMVFETVAGDRKFALHHPEVGGLERATFLDFLDFGETIAIRRCRKRASFDVAAYVWPAYHPAERWKELGIFKDGKGEWQNQYESRKRTSDDYQGAKPLWGYENEADPVVVARKIDAATSAGVNVFIYDWYWYGGRPFLQEALENGFLKAQNRSRMKFYVMYANHNVDRLWDRTVGKAGKKELVWSAKITDEDWERIVRCWIGYFKEQNYYTIKGCPVLMIYDVTGFVGWEGAEKARSRVAYLREETRKAGFPGLHLQTLCTAYFPTDPPCNQADIGADSMSIYNWRYKTAGRLESTKEPELTYAQWGALSLAAMDETKDAVARRKAVYFPHLSLGWDTNARYPDNERRNIVHGSNPADFERFARVVRDWADRHIPAEYPRLITVNSWNEWTEGSYLEPDDRFGYGYLNALRRVFVEER